MKRENIKIMVVDDHLAFRKGIINLLNQYKWIIIAGEASNGHEYLQNVESIMPDIVLMDIKMNNINGIEATKISTQTYPGIKIIALTFEKESDYITDLMQAGAKDILYKDAPISEIIATIIKIHNGDSYYA